MIKGENITHAITPGQTQLAYTVRSGGFCAGVPYVRIVNVLRYTSTQVVCQLGAGEIRFNLSNGSERGGNYGSRAEVLTEKIKDGILRSKLDLEARGLGSKLEELARELAHKDWGQMSARALELNVDRLKVVILAVEGMLEMTRRRDRFAIMNRETHVAPYIKQRKQP